jgi:hypothetical protein
LELELSICKASDVAELVRARDRDNIPFSIVISLEGPGDDFRAPRLKREIGAYWAERQVIFTCNDVESGPGAPSRLLVQRALDHFAKWQPTMLGTRIHKGPWADLPRLVSMNQTFSPPIATKSEPAMTPANVGT